MPEPDQVPADPEIPVGSDQVVPPSSTAIINAGLVRSEPVGANQIVPELPSPSPSTSSVASPIVEDLESDQVVPMSTEPDQEEITSVSAPSGRSESSSSWGSDIDRVLDMEDDGEFSESEGEWTPPTSPR